ncbi:hypothetical protein PYW08_002067 [Mythimna loreyi]|uniref:Uncharacterized protein n=1 Tax=Mythimna loreyi TaxID=667449 RepID=A0ACC2R330_9NEOP|nr:hypothetical protein PYW08_002067 [Mythimna loreyi]
MSAKQKALICILILTVVVQFAGSTFLLKKLLLKKILEKPSPDCANQPQPTVAELTPVKPEPSCEPAPPLPPVHVPEPKPVPPSEPKKKGWLKGGKKDSPTEQPCA